MTRTSVPQTHPPGDDDWRDWCSIWRHHSPAPPARMTPAAMDMPLDVRRCRPIPGYIC
jgi:hypothetical protein